MLKGDETPLGQPAFEKKASINTSQPSSLVDFNAKLKRKESLSLFDRVIGNTNMNMYKTPSSQKTTQGTQGYNEGESDDSSLMDNSFRKALKDAKIQVIFSY